MQSSAGAHVVGACDDLPAAGTWQEISPIPGDNPALANDPVWLKSKQGTKWGAAVVVSHPSHAGVVYAGVPRGGIWKSPDCGATWQKTNTGEDGAVIDSGIQFFLALAPGTLDTLYVNNFQGSQLAFFKSSDSGENWAPLYDANSAVAKQVEYGGYGNALSLDPNDDQHLLINFHANCSAPNGGCIGESIDGGTSWTLAKGPLSEWAEGSSLHFVTRTAWLFGAHAGLFYTPDRGESWTQVAPSANVGGIVRASTGMYYMGADQGVLQSEDLKVWTVIPNSPPTITLVATGQNLYTGDFNFSGENVISSAPEDNPTTWTRVATPTMPTLGGPWRLAYDSDHHILYSANKSAGLWRTVLP